MSQEERDAITLINHDKKIFAILHKPLYAKKVPAVVFCPGFGGTKVGKHRLLVRLAQELAKQEIAVLRFDYRGAGDSEGEFDEMTVETQLSDTLLGLDYVANQANIDPDRIGLLGRSLGGAIAVLAARRFVSVKSMALWAPVFSSEPWQKLWESYQKKPLQFAPKDVLASLPNMPSLAFLQQFFNLDIAQELSGLSETPLLHIHGEHDNVVKIEHAESYRKIRQENEKTRFIKLATGDHDFSDVQDQKTALLETVRWFKDTL